MSPAPRLDISPFSGPLMRSMIDLLQSRCVVVSSYSTVQSKGFTGAAPGNGNDQNDIICLAGQCIAMCGWRALLMYDPHFL